MIYLDHNASTPVDPEVSDAVFSTLRRDYGNASSSHDIGRRASEILEKSRSLVSEFLGCLPEEFIFTSGGTESNNLAILGRAFAAGKGHIITSAIEHPSVLSTCRHLGARGFDVTEVPVDRDGIVSLGELGKAIRRETILISVMHANNETGVLQPVSEIGVIARKHKVAFHVDAAQSVGKIPFTLKDSGIDLLTVAAHKFNGPKGIGGLYVRNGVPLAPVSFGASHERGLRPGTENVPLAAGLAKACEIAGRDMKSRVTRTGSLRELLHKLISEGFPDIKLNGHQQLRLPNTLNISFPGVQASDLLERIDHDVAASSGSACHAGSAKPSAVLKQMGISDADALSSVRLSVGKDNTEEEIRSAAGIIVSAARELRKSD